MVHTSLNSESDFLWECSNQNLEATKIFPLTLTPLSIGIAAPILAGEQWIKLLHKQKVIAIFRISKSEEIFNSQFGIYTIQESKNFIQNFLQQLITRLVFAVMNPIKRRHQRITMTVNDLIHLYNLYILPVPVYLLSRVVGDKQITFPIDLVYLNCNEGKAIVALHANNKNQLQPNEEIVISNVSVEHASVIANIDRDLHQQKKNNDLAQAVWKQANNGVSYPVLGNNIFELCIDQLVNRNGYVIYSCAINSFDKNDNLVQLAHTSFFANKLKP